MLTDLAQEAKEEHGTSPQMNDVSTSLVDIGTVLHVLWRARHKLALVSGGAFTLAVIIALLIPATYTASASFVPPSNSGNSSALAASLGALSMLSPTKSTGDLYIGILKSHSIADRMVDRFGLVKVYRSKKRSVAEKTLAGNSSFEVDVKSSIINIKVVDQSPQRARDMANVYMEEVRSIGSGLALTESSQRRLFFEQRLSQEKDDLANAEVALKQTEEKTGLIAPAGQTAAEIQAIAQIRAEITGREVRLASLRHDETDDNPDIMRLKNEVASLQGRLTQMESGREAGTLSTSRVPSLALEYIRKEREVKYHEALFEIISKQYENARLDEAHDPPLQILDRAEVPDTKSGPPRTIISLIGMIAGFLVEALWLLFQAARQRDRLLLESSGRETLQRYSST